MCTFKNTQYIAYYNSDGYVVLGKRKINSTKWQLSTTSLKGNVADAHNSISIITDGDGYLHLAWNHHGSPLKYCKTVAQGSLQLTPALPMTGLNEQSVTYPEFYTMPDGNLVFLYRDGQSGRGNLVVNRYITKQKQWVQLHQNLIDGEAQRNAYWQACVDEMGTIHLSWVWRETADVSTNHDICYAKSTDGGLTWMSSKNERYLLPVTASTAEYICRIPQNSTLINQTSICTDNNGNPFIATYFKAQSDSTPQYHILYNTIGQWQVKNTGFRTTPFSLGGSGTKRIPISRPQVAATTINNQRRVFIIFRDEERGSKISIATNTDSTFEKWQLYDLPGSPVGSWEPAYDTELWKQQKQLHLFVQHTQQADGEGRAIIKPQPVYVTEILFKR